MKLTRQHSFGPLPRLRARAFTLVEIMVAMAILGISFISLYAGITAGVGLLQSGRENLRATQIMVDQMESVRICTWEQVTRLTTDGTALATNFTAHFHPKDTNGTMLTFHGTISVEDAALGTAYNADVRKVTISLNWTNFGMPHSREMTTLVARNGLQNYIF
jgi:prepilin-type N-terminal cleavage/methylation domain-containing protein